MLLAGCDGGLGSNVIGRDVTAVQGVRLLAGSVGGSGCDVGGYENTPMEVGVLSGDVFGGVYRTRTDHLLTASQTLYQMS